MERHIQILHKLTILAIATFCIMQCYWLYGRYTDTQTRMGDATAAAVIKAVDDDLAHRRLLAGGNKSMGVYSNMQMSRQDSINSLRWKFGIYVVDKNTAGAVDSIAVKKAIKEFESMHSGNPATTIGGITKYEFEVNNSDEGKIFKALEMFETDELSPFNARRLTAALERDGIRCTSASVDKADSAVWMPTVVNHVNTWNPYVETTVPYDILQGQTVKIITPLTVSSTISDMALTLFCTAITSILLIFCLIRQLLTIFKQRRLEKLRHDFIRRMAGEMRRMKEGHTEPKTTFNFGNTTFDSRNSQLSFADTTQRRLSARQCEILKILANDTGRLVERDYILVTVWGDNSYANSLSLNVQITHLRRMLAPDPSVSIVSVKKKGYILRVEQNTRESK